MGTIIVAYTPVFPRGTAAAAIWRGIMTLPASLPRTGSSDDFRSIFEMSAVPIVQVDLRTGRFLLVNDAFCRLLEYTAPELRDTMTVLDVTPPADREETAALVRALAAGVVHQVDLEKRYAKALDVIVGAGTGDGLTPTGEKMRRLMHYGQMFQSHALHFFHLGSPDLLLPGIDADPAIRNVIGVAIHHKDLAVQDVMMRKFGQEIIAATAGKKIHGTGAIPGGVNKNLSLAECGMRF